MIQVFARNDLTQLHEEGTIRHVVEHEEQLLVLILQQLIQMGIFHHIVVLIRSGIHLNTCDLCAFAPILIADEERGHLIFGVVD